MRRFSRVIVTLILLALLMTSSSPLTASEPQEFYELRIYRISSAEKQNQMSSFLEQAYLPALHRLGLERVGVFTVQRPENDHSIVMLIPFGDLNDFTSLGQRLSDDSEFGAASAEFLEQPLRDPVYERVESRLLRAFSGMPVMELPEYSKAKSERIFELRLYESHTESFAARKIDMFNSGEIQLMRDVSLGPVFFGETLIGPDVPNLVYMLSAENDTAHREHWQAFLADPRWETMKDLPQYKNTVSGIKNWFLVPTKYSDL